MIQNTENYLSLVLQTLERQQNSISFEELQYITGLESHNLLKYLCELTDKKRILIKINPLSVDNNIYSKRANVIFDEFKHLLLLYFRAERSVSFYADKLFITPKYLSTVVKEISGISPKEWISNITLQEIKYKLLYSSISVKEIAYSLNFPNCSFFGKYFKTHIGISPTRYRAQKTLNKTFYSIE